VSILGGIADTAEILLPRLLRRLENNGRCSLSTFARGKSDGSKFPC
jgi:hypothetical protein